MNQAVKHASVPIESNSAQLGPSWSALKLAIGAGLLVSAWAALVTPRPLGERCIVVFGFLLTLGLGGLFFTLLHHALGARWSVGAVAHCRGIVEQVAIAMLLLVPIVLCVDETWPWFKHQGADWHLLNGFAATYQRTPFLVARLALCCASWLCLAHFYRGNRSWLSVRSKHQLSDAQLRFWSGPALVVLALTLTAFSFDWVMALQPGWHSAVLGVYLFAGAVPAALATLALITVALKSSNASNSLSAAVQHDIGKLLFGFSVFWGYIAFCQYLLIWYADLPSEIGFYQLRALPAWRALTGGLIALRVVVPLVTLLSARAKQSSLGLTIAAGSVLVGHWLDWYWLVMPALEPRGVRLGVADIAGASLCLLAVSWGVLRGFIPATRDVPQRSIQAARAA